MPRFSPSAVLSYLASDTTVLLATNARSASCHSTTAPRTWTKFKSFRQGAIPPVVFMSSSSYRSSGISRSFSDIGSMRAGEIRKELEAYGVRTKSFLEKSELVAALQKARLEGSTPIQDSPPSSSSAAGSTTTSNASLQSRDDLVAKEVAALQSKKTTELKSELELLGISTKSFFEKPEFVMALAEARVDGVDNSNSGGAVSAANGDYADHTNLEVSTDPRSKSSTKEHTQTPDGGDSFQNTTAGSTGGGLGGNPFANMGADTKAKARKLMSNPEAMKIVLKSHKNPRIVAAVREIASNPAAIVKYHHDPEINALVQELKEFVQV